MKKRSKIIMAAAVLVALPATVNHFIEKHICQPFSAKFRQLTYDWKFGKISYTKSGQGEPLLLLHGISIGSAGHEWDSVINSLSRHYTVYVPDLIGFGNSDKPEISYSAYLYASLINDFIKDVIGKSVNVAASSKSGDFLVAAYRLKPEYYEKMLLIAPTGINGIAKKSPYSRKLIDLPLYGTFGYYMMSSMAFILHFLKKNVYFDSQKADMEILEKYHKAAHFGGKANRYPIGAFLSGHLDVDISKMITEVAVPIHIVWGADNELNPVNAIYDLEKTGMVFGFTVFENSRLLPHSEHPSKFIKLSLRFFSS